MPAATSTSATSTASTAPRRLRLALGDIKRFLDRNPDEVVILFIGDYVSADDTATVFQEAGLYDRLYSYDGSQPPPTLGQMVDARQNIFLLSEFTGHPPAWNNPGYGALPGHAVHLHRREPAHRRGGRRLGAVGHHLRHRPGRRHRGLPGHRAADGHHALVRHRLDGPAQLRPQPGSPDSPLFQINHWVTPAGAAPTVAQAGRSTPTTCSCRG